MAVPTDKQRGYQDAPQSGAAQGTLDRGTKGRGIPGDLPSTDRGRWVKYRIENTLPLLPGNTNANLYPHPVNKWIPQGEAAPDRFEIATSPRGRVLVRAEPDLYGPKEDPPKPPAPVQVPEKPRPPHKKTTQKKREAPAPPPPPPKAPPPPGPIQCPPGYVPTKSGHACMPSDELQAKRDEQGRAQERAQAIRDYTDATLGDGFENASKVAEWASKLIPGPAGRVFKSLGYVFKTGHEIYEAEKLVKELVIQLNQVEAAEKGAKEVTKRTEDALQKTAEKELDKLLKQRKIPLPDAAKKEIIKRARELFDEKIRDPAIKKGKEELEKTIDDKDRNTSLWDQWMRGSTTFHR